MCIDPDVYGGGSGRDEVGPYHIAMSYSECGGGRGRDEVGPYTVALGGPVDSQFGYFSRNSGTSRYTTCNRKLLPTIQNKWKMRLEKWIQLKDG